MRKHWAVLVGLAVVSVSVRAQANGRFPGAFQLVVRDRNTALATSFGLVSSSDRMRSTFWGCERALGYDPLQNQDVGVAILPNGRILMSGASGLSSSIDGGCDSTFEGGLFAGKWVADVSVDEGRPSSALALVRGARDGTCDGSIVETTDQGATWNTLAKLPADFCAMTLDSAPADPNRIYVSGNVIVGAAALKGVVLTSRDRGVTWSTTTFADHARPFIGAMSPMDPDTFWVRTLEPPASGSLLVTHDGGRTFTEIAVLSGSPLQYFGVSGVAVSPDGKRIAYGSVGQGLFVADAVGNATPERRSDIPITCLTWARDGLYACSTPGRCGPFFVGRSTDEGLTFDTVLADTSLANTRMACAPTTKASLCGAPPASPPTSPSCPTPQATAPEPLPTTAPAASAEPQALAGCTCEVKCTSRSGALGAFSTVGAVFALVFVRRLRRRSTSGAPWTQRHDRR